MNLKDNKSMGDKIITIIGNVFFALVFVCGGVIILCGFILFLKLFFGVMFNG